MDDVLRRSYAPHVMVVASPDCVSIYDHPLISTNNAIKLDSGMYVRLIPLSKYAQNKSHEQMSTESDVSAIIDELRSSQTPGFYETIVERLVTETFDPEHAQAFETFGHPVACILAVSSANPSPISALTQLYQQSYLDCAPGMSADFLRCVWYIQADASPTETTEDFATVASQFGPHCFEVANCGADAIEGAINTVMTHSVAPYMHRVVKEWQQANTGRSAQNGFGFGKLLKKLVTGGPPRPETNVFFDVCREMQPHVASIPAKRGPNSINSKGVDIDMQLRRLADVAFMLQDYKLAYMAYESLRKPFASEQKWAQLGACSEMAGVSGVLVDTGNAEAAVDTALYTYNARLHLPAHALRCVLVVCSCLVEYGDKLLAAGLLATTLLELDPVYGTGDVPSETAMIMERISLAFEKRGWHRKSKLWTMLAQREWERCDAS